jgi:hypothetical protein
VRPDANRRSLLSEISVTRECLLEAETSVLTHEITLFGYCAILLYMMQERTSYMLDMGFDEFCWDRLLEADTTFPAHENTFFRNTVKY